MNQKGAIRYLSLAAKAGKIITGGDDCEKAVRKQHRTGLIILAADAGTDAVRRAEALSRSSEIRLMKSAFKKSELAAAVGRGSSVAIALVIDEGLAAAFAAASGMEQEECI